MPQYVVVTDCYVPVAESTRFKRAGQVVTLDATDAKVLGDLVKPASDSTVEAQQVAPPAPVHVPSIVDPTPAPPAPKASPPSESDLKAAWVDFAVAEGETRETAEALTKVELIERFG